MQSHGCEIVEGLLQVGFNVSWKFWFKLRSQQDILFSRITFTFDIDDSAAKLNGFQPQKKIQILQTSLQRVVVVQAQVGVSLKPQICLQIRAQRIQNFVPEMNHNLRFKIITQSFCIFQMLDIAERTEDILQGQEHELKQLKFKVKIISSDTTFNHLLKNKFQRVHFEVWRCLRVGRRSEGVEEGLSFGVLGLFVPQNPDYLME